MNDKRGRNPHRSKYSTLSFICLTLLLVTAVKAHIVEQFYADFSQANGSLILNFDVAYALPDTRNDPEAPQPKRSWLVKQSDAQHQRLRKEAVTYLKSYIQFQVNNQPVNFKVSFPDFDQKPYPFIKLLNQGAYYTAEITPILPDQTPQKLAIKINPGSSPNLVLAHQIAKQITFKTIKPSMILSLELEQTPPTKPTPEHQPPPPSLTSLTLISLGFRHVIPDGPDHILFIIGMCLIASSVRQLLYQSLIFTLSHALSMALVISDLFPIYTYSISIYIEALIALSIAFIAAETLFLKQSIHSKPQLTWRFSLIAIFGFIHGLGFAGSLGSSLQFLLLDNWILPLTIANLGIEIAQAILIISSYNTLLYIKKHHSVQLEQTLRTTSAIIIAAFSILWFFQRLP